MKKNMRITLAAPEDSRGIGEVFYQTWLETYPNEKAGVTREDIEDRFTDRRTDEAAAKRAENIKNPPAGEAMFVAKDGEKVVGVCRAAQREDGNQIQAIYVLPEYQGKGVGMGLWKAAQKVFDPKKDTTVEVATYNAKAIKFYRRLGFEDTGRRFEDPRFTMKSGVVLPQLEMILKAGTAPPTDEA